MTNILVIYTGGTIGMKQHHETGVWQPFNFEQIIEEVPVLKKFGFTIDTLSFDPLIDSSEAQPSFWVKLVQLISDNYTKYDGFVVLHGTDTMSYTASALSFMLENLEKPIILTGSQLPIGMLRTDGMENLVSAIEIAAAKENGHPCVPEVCIFFENQLFRGNRTTKDNAEQFKAFRSANYPALANAGVYIKFNTPVIQYPTQWGKPLKINTHLDNNVAVLKIFPGISQKIMEGILNTNDLRAVILETYGSGNAPTSPWFIHTLKQAIDRGLILVNITQCAAGSVEMDKYETGMALKKAGVLSGHDSTIEAALTKLFLLLGKYKDNQTIKNLWQKNISGEISLI
ncbi:MAG: type I asparaginase [Prevotellaceae bacterium]|jgi:L-asparaginase|nr:type I asparaginase [Prevotellaceae bacterium]